jgi:hypothetical protein
MASHYTMGNVSGAVCMVKSPPMDGVCQIGQLTPTEQETDDANARIQ